MPGIRRTNGKVPEAVEALSSPTIKVVSQKTHELDLSHDHPVQYPEAASGVLNEEET
jgi:hypothetical protein